MKSKSKGKLTWWKITLIALACIAGIAMVFAAPIAAYIAATTVTPAPVEYADVYKALRSAGRGSLYYGLYGIIEYSRGAVFNASPSAPKSEPRASSDDFSNTNIQVEGVDEADIVKTDGRYIYVLSRDILKIFDVDGRTVVGSYKMDEDCAAVEMYLVDGRVSIVFTKSERLEEQPSLWRWYYYPYKQETGIVAVDVSNPASPKKVASTIQSGGYLTSRCIDDSVYVITDYTVWNVPADGEDIEMYIPQTRNDAGDSSCFEANDIIIPSPEEYADSYVVVVSYNAKNAAVKDTKSILGYGFDIYCTADNLFIYNTRYVASGGDEWFNYTEYTCISSYALKKGSIEYKATESIIGYANDQFSFHYANDTLFVCTTYRVAVSTLPEELRQEYKDMGSVNMNGLFALGNDLKLKGSVTGLGVDETIRSARFVGNYCYFVTFRQTDPLFAVDISNPTKPTVVSELKIPGYSTYLHPYADGLLLGFGYDGDEEGMITGLKLSMFDVSDPKNVIEKNRILLGDKLSSDALYNHKAIYVNEGKRLIGIPAWEWGYQSFENKYLLYNYDAENGYSLAASVIFDETPISHDGYQRFDTSGVRGLHIGDIFYVVGDGQIIAVSLLDFTELYRVTL